MMRVAGPWHEPGTMTAGTGVADLDNMAIRNMRVQACRFGRPLGLVLAFVGIGEGDLRAQDFTATIPVEYTEACDLDRSDLTGRVVARNQKVYPRLVAQTSDGWLIYDRYEKHVVELDEDLRNIQTWGRAGPGPLEYDHPVGLGRLDSSHVVVVDANPPSLIVFGRNGSEHRLAMFARPRHAIVAEHRVLVATDEGTVHEVTVGGEVSTLHGPGDFGLSDPSGLGATPAPRLRAGYMAFTGPSAIWRLGSPPRQIVQRCIHDDLVGMLVEAIQVDTPFGRHPFNLTTLQDFLPLNTKGFLALGGLVVRVDKGRESQKLRSIEHYDSAGRLRQAWQLNGYPLVRGVFDSNIPGRMLVWNEEEIDGIQLLEVDGLDAVNR